MRSFPDENTDFQSLWDELRRFLHRKLARYSSAEDVAQEAMIEALRRPPRHAERIGAWLKVVALRRATRLSRSEKRREAREFVVARPEAAWLPPEGADLDPAHVTRYVLALREPYRTVVRMRYLEEREIDDIAAFLGRPPATVRSQLKRGLDQLRTRFAPEGQEERSRRYGLFALVFARLREGGRFACAAAGVAGVAGLAWVVLDRAPQELAVNAGTSAHAESAAAADLARVEDATLGPLPLSPPPISAPLADPPSASAAVWTLDLEGVVSNSDGTPVPDANVCVENAADGSVRVAAVSDAEGRYRAANVGALDWIWAQADGRLPTERFLAGSTRGNRLDFLVARTFGVVRGRVVAADGSPVAGARVTRRFLRGGADRHSIGLEETLALQPVPVWATTDSEGCFTMPRVAPGLPNQGLLDIRADGHPPSIQSVPVDSGQAEDEFRLPSPVRLAARVFDGNGAVLGGAMMEVLLPEPLEARRTLTSESGLLEVDGLPPGPYALRLLRHPRGALEACFAEGVIACDSTTEVTLDAKSLVHGVASVGGRPAPGRRIRLRQIGSGRFAPDERTALTAEDGSFGFLGCDPSGRYEVRLLDANGLFVEAVASDLAPSDEPVRLESEGPSSLAVLSAVCESLGQLPTMVALHSAALVEPLVLRVAEDGTLASPPIPRGRYSLRFWVPGIGTWARTHALSDGAEPVRIRFGDTGALEIRVIPPAGSSIERLVTAFVSCPAFIGTASRDVWREIGGGKGAKRVELPPGKYEYLVRVPGFLDELHRVTIEEGVATFEDVHLQKGVTTTVEIVGPRDLRREEFVVHLSRPSGEQRLRPVVRPAHGVIDTVHVSLGIPTDTVAVRVRTKSGLRGRTEVSATELTPGSAIRVRLE